MTQLEDPIISRRRSLVRGGITVALLLTLVISLSDFGAAFINFVTGAFDNPAEKSESIPSVTVDVNIDISVSDGKSIDVVSASEIAYDNKIVATRHDEKSFDFSHQDSQFDKGSNNFSGHHFPEQKALEDWRRSIDTHSYTISPNYASTEGNYYTLSPDY